MSARAETPAETGSKELILDRVSPISDATSSHQVIVAAPPERVWAALQELDLADVIRSSRAVLALIEVRVKQHAAAATASRPGSRTERSLR